MNDVFEVMRLNQLARQLSLPVDMEGSVEFGSIDRSGRFDYATWNLPDDFLEELSNSELKALLVPLLDIFIQTRFSFFKLSTDISGVINIKGGQLELEWLK